MVPAFEQHRKATVSEFKGATLESPAVDAVKATARFPGLEIEILHRRLPSGDAEQISIILQATPSFEAFGRFIEAANPLAFWAQATWLAWSPWLEATRVAMLPWRAASPSPKGGADAGTSE